MSEPYLIAHVVRGEPAFDIAIQLDLLDEDGEPWWIIPTSGHRAYPYWSCALGECLVMGMGEYESITYGVPSPPPNWPDHYAHSSAPRALPLDLAAALGIRKPQIITRRR